MPAAAVLIPLNSGRDTDLAEKTKAAGFIVLIPLNSGRDTDENRLCGQRRSRVLIPLNSGRDTDRALRSDWVRRQGLNPFEFRA